MEFWKSQGHFSLNPATPPLTSETIIDLQSAITNVLTRTQDALGRPAGFSLSPLPLGEGQGEGTAPYSVAYAYDEHGRFGHVAAMVGSSIATNTYNYAYRDTAPKAKDPYSAPANILPTRSTNTPP